MLSCVSKVLEGLIDDHIRSHLVATNFLSPAQHGFRSAHSCTTNLLLAQESWSQAIDSGGGVDVVYLDFAKAFDRVDHTILLHKLAGCGVSGSLLAWLQDYLRNRKFRVRVHGHLSDIHPAPSGVPQGSILGPLMFLVFINDIASITTNPLLLFADDIKIWARLDSPNDGETLQSDLNKLNNWAINNRLPFNTSKCTCLHIKNSDNSTYTLESNPIEAVSKQRDLGTIMSKSLSMAENSETLARKANCVLRMINRNLGNIEAQFFCPIFKTVVRPLLETNAQASQPILARDIKLLENVQRRATKKVRGLSNLDYSARLQTLGLFSLEYRRCRGDMILTHKILHSPHHPCANLLHPLGTDNLRGHSLRLSHLRSKTKIRYYSFSVRVPRTWNRLPPEVVTATTTNDFKRKYDAFNADRVYSSDSHHHDATYLRYVASTD